MGTPEYMSPEQARGEEMTASSDIYSAGVVLYHLITGQVPFLGDNPVATALKHVTDPPVRPSAHRRMNPRLEAACLKALKKDPARTVRLGPRHAPGAAGGPGAGPRDADGHPRACAAGAAVGAAARNARPTWPSPRGRPWCCSGVSAGGR